MAAQRSPNGQARFRGVSVDRSRRPADWRPADSGPRADGLTGLACGSCPERQRMIGWTCTRKCGIADASSWSASWARPRARKICARVRRSSPRSALEAGSIASRAEHPIARSMCASACAASPVASAISAAVRKIADAPVYVADRSPTHRRPCFRLAGRRVFGAEENPPIDAKVSRCPSPKVQGLRQRAGTS